MIWFNGFCIDFGFEHDLYEHDRKTNLRVLIKGEPTHTLSAPVSFATYRIRQTIALSNVFVFHFKEQIYLGMLRVTKTDLLLFLYLTSETEMRERCGKFVEKPSVLLDLDKTLILTYEDVTRNHDKFVTHFRVDSYKAIDNLPFHNSIMMRYGVDVFLKKLSEIANIYIITASDLHYAEEIVHAANKIGWGSDFQFPESNVYSTRNHPKTALLKTFDFIVPEIPEKVIAVDDNLGAWIPELRQHVYKINPFEPGEDESEFVKVFDTIETNLKIS